MSNDQNDSQSLPNGLPHGDSNMHHGDSNLVSPTGHLSGSTSNAIDVQTTSLAQELDAEVSGSFQSPSAQSGSQASPDQANALEFRVVRPGAPVRRLRLTGTRYTFGSGEGCSIQLDDPTLRPMHAVLLRDAHRILMRAYSVPLECNGSRVTESALRIGDIIRMGSYRFELLAAPGFVVPTDAERQNLRSAPKRLASSGDSLEGQLKDRLTELSQQWHARHAECEIRETRCDQRETELHSRESELWSRAENLRHRESLLNAQEAAAREIEETYAATQEELRELRERDQESTEALKAKETELLEKSQQLRERQAELERRQAEWKTREEEFDRRSSEAQKQLEHSQQQAEAASSAVTKMRDEFAHLNSQLTDLRERHSELQDREQQEQEEHERLRLELESKYDAALETQTHHESQTNETLKELEQVTADLESTRSELKQVREESKARQQELTERLRCTGEELQSAREETLIARKSLEEEQAYAENRIIELEESLTSAQQSRAAIERAAESQQKKYLEKIEVAEQERCKAESTAETLRNSIQDLHENVAKANEEVSQLRADKEGSDASIRQLELLVDQTQNNQSAQQESWEHEAEQLRLTIEDLSIQLSSANVELSQLRSANEALTDELARSEEPVEPPAPTEQDVLDSETFQRLEQELISARDEIDRLKISHEETVSRLEAEREESESALRDEIENLRQDIVAAQESAEARIQQIVANDSVATTEMSQLQLSASEDPEGHESFVDNRDDLNSSPEISDTIDCAATPTEFDLNAEHVTHGNSFDASPQTSHSDSFSLDGSDEETATVSTGGELTESFAAAAIALEGQSAPRQSSDEMPLGDDEATTTGEIAANDLTATDSAGESEWNPAEQNQDQSERLTGDAQADGWSPAAWDQQSEFDLSAETGTFSDESESIDNEEIDSTVSWHDESPENAVADTIDEIEHGVEQVIADYEPQSSSSDETDAVETDLSSEANLGWSEPSDAEMLSVTTDLADSHLSQHGEQQPKSDDPWNRIDNDDDGVAEETPVAEMTSDLATDSELPSDLDWDSTPFSSDAELPIEKRENTLDVAESNEIEEEDVEASLEESPSDAEIVREFASRGEEDSPLDWTAYMPGGQVEPPADEAESAIDAPATETTTTEDTSFEIGSPDLSDEATLPETESPERDGWNSTQDAASEFSHESFETQSFTESWDSGPLPDASVTSEQSQPIEATEQWAGNEDNLPEPVDPLASLAPEPAIEAETTFERASNQSESLAHEESTLQEDPPPSNEGSLAAMLIKDLTEDSPAADEDADEPTLMMESEVDLDSIHEEEASSEWNFESPGEILSSESELSPPEPTGLDTLDPVEDEAGVDFPEAELRIAGVSGASGSQSTDPLNRDQQGSPEPVEDDSIEAYMSRLLQRVQGDPSAPEPVPTSASTSMKEVKESPGPEEASKSDPSETVDPVADGTSLTDSESESSEESAVETPPADNTPLVPRSQAPELSRNLSAMRELANQSARNAVARSIRIQARDTQMKAFFKAGLAVVAIAMAIGVYVFVGWSPTIKIAMVGAFVVLAAVFGQEGYVLARDAKRRLALAETGTGEDKSDIELEEEIQRIAEEVQGQ